MKQQRPRAATPHLVNSDMSSWNVSAIARFGLHTLNSAISRPLSISVRHRAAILLRGPDLPPAQAVHQTVGTQTTNHHKLNHRQSCSQAMPNRDTPVDTTANTATANTPIRITPVTTITRMSKPGGCSNTFREILTPAFTVLRSVLHL